MTQSRVLSTSIRGSIYTEALDFHSQKNAGHFIWWDQIQKWSLGLRRSKYSYSKERENYLWKERTVYWESYLLNKLSSRSRGSQPLT